jgi:hypothetical protein
MKKTLLFAFALLFATATMAQNRAVMLQESFDGSSMPAGWSIAGLGQSNWNISATNNAGGEANEIWLYYGPQFNGISRLVSPVVDLTGLNSVIISFKHCLDNYSGSHTLGIATTSDGGSTWNEAWSQVYSSDGVYAVTQEVTTPDVGSANFQFCIYYSGNSYNIDNWYFDDIMAFTLENLDLAITGTSLPAITPTGDLTVNMSVMNYGATPITSIEASYEVSGMETVNQTFNVNLASLATTTLTFDAVAAMNIPGSYVVTLTIIKVNGQVDDVLDNNMLMKSVSIPLDNVQRIPMIEHFSSSTCGPCVSVNNQMNTFCNNNAGRFTYTKYQMNWPGSGDPYYTAEGGVRRAYYGVSGVPDIYLDGVGTNNAAVNQNTFNQHADEPGYFDVRGSFTVEGNNIHIFADVMPYVDVEARVYVAINEKVTHGNVGTNGETEFHHVFMKMMPNGEGSTIAFTTGEMQRLEFTQDMSGTHVEEMSDLEVSIWVQNHGSKYVYNSHFAYEYTEVHPYPVENLTLTEVAGPRGLFAATWDAPSQGNPIGYDVYVNNQLVAEGITATEYSFEGDPDMFYVVGVVALYPNELSSVKVVAVVTETLQDMGLVINGSAEVMLDVNQPMAEVFVTNANYNTQNPIEILQVEEAENPTGVPYLYVTTMDLPYTLSFGEDFMIRLEPNTGDLGRSVASTVVRVESSVGTVEFLVEIDGELLKVTEVSSTPKLYPNPANDQVRIMANNSIESVKVYNMMGTLVETIPANGNAIDVNLSQYSNGVYFFNIRQSDGTISNQRVVVRH